MSDQDVVYRLNAALEGRYRIERELGEGGMATVYLADDLRHERKVAVKVLRPELAAVVGAERFLAEIKTTANLQHPHILPLFDSGEVDKFLFYVMPYVEGESLRERLDREHQLPVEEAVRIASDVAEALEYAHSHGVIHRDIKPANILLHAGRPLIADFGIALAVSAGGGGRLTETGLSLGTPHYMSPEQATGDLSVGPATDIYALGCVLYEALVGHPPYIGGTAQAILGKIVTGEADPVSKHRKSVAPNVDAAIRRALEKVPADRFATAADFGGALNEAGFRHGDARASTSTSGASAFWKSLAITSTIVALLLAVFSIRGPQGAPRGGTIVRVESPFATAQEPIAFASNAFALSPDGSMLVYMGRGPGPVPEDAAFAQLMLRRWSDLDAAPVRGTVGATQPAVSPDGETLAFIQDGTVKVVPLAGGPVTPLAEGGRYPRWGPDGDIYFAGPATDWAVQRVPSTGGAPEIVRPLAEGEESQYVWDFLPGGEVALAFVRHTGASDPIVGLLRLATGEMTELFPGAAPQYAASGHLVFEGPDSSLMAAPFDARSLEAGPPVRIVGNVQFFSFSHTGTLVYSTFGSVGRVHSRLLQVGEGGAPQVLAEAEGMASFPRFSPDGSRLAYAVGSTNTNQPADLYVLDVSRRAPWRVTFGGNNRFFPIWTPDGTRLVYADGTGAQNRLLSSPADGRGGSDTLLALGDRRFPSSWAPDGRTLAYYVGPAGTTTNSRDIWMLHVDGDALTPEPFIQTEFMERGATFSPDGGWVAYVSDKSGQNVVYARPYPGAGPEVTISVGGGSEPVWGPKGDRIYYRRENELVVVDVQPSAQSLTASVPRHVMDDRYMRDVAAAPGGMANYDVAPSEDLFVMVELVEEDAAEAGKMYLVLNWLEELSERVPVD